MNCSKRKKRIFFLFIIIVALSSVGVVSGVFEYIFDSIINRYEDRLYDEVMKKTSTAENEINHVHVDGELLVTFKEGVTTSTIADINKQFGAQKIEKYRIHPEYHIKVPINSASNTAYFLHEYQKLPQVEFVHYNWRY